MKTNQIVLLTGLSALLIGGVMAIEVLTNSAGPRDAGAIATEVPFVPQTIASGNEVHDSAIDIQTQAAVTEPVDGMTDFDPEQIDVEQSDLATSMDVEPLEVENMPVVSGPVVRSSTGSEGINDDPIIITAISPYQSSVISSTGGVDISSGGVSGDLSGVGDISSGGGGGGSSDVGDISSGGGSSSGGGGGGSTGVGDDSPDVGDNPSGDDVTAVDSGVTVTDTVEPDPIVNTVVSGIGMFNKTGQIQSDCLTAIFLNRLELMTKDSWYSAKLHTSIILTNLKKYNAVWCGQLIEEHHPEAFKEIRQTDPEQLIFYYLSGNTIDKLGGFVCLDYDYIKTYHPEWLLLKDTRTGNYRVSNDLMRWNSTDKNLAYYDRFFIDVGNPAFQTWAVDYIVKKLRQKQAEGFRYDGLAMDNVLLRVWHKMKDNMYPNWKYANDEDGWVQAYHGYIGKLHDTLSENGFKLILNHTTDYTSNRNASDWDQIMSISDGLMDEKCMSSSGETFEGSRWLWTVQHHDDTLSAGLIDWWMAKLPEDEELAFLQLKYIYCSFLLSKQPGRSYFYSDKDINDGEINQVIWEVYSLPIGKPVAARYQKNECWIRDYENARIVVNPTEHTLTIDLEEPFPMLDWFEQKSVTDVILPAKTAKILFIAK
ncbi:MAG: hypothetical protein KAS23_05310 [Anaerohalosphaera sp.]|nr:hypothetical protein [Anaerohalosphaera sp.]